MIGIIGGYGDIGGYVVQFIDRYSKHTIKLGGRHPREPHGTLKNKHITCYVDVNDEKSLTDFVRDCKTVINCTGINGEGVLKIVETAQKLGCHYVDLGMNCEFKRFVSENNRNSIVYCSGSLPGLAEILMIYLGEKIENIDRMNFYYGAQGRFSKTASKDYLEGLTNSNHKSMVYWKNEDVVTYDSFEKLNQELPFAEQNFSLFPYFDEGALYVAQKLKLREGKWYMAFAGEKILKALEYGRMHYGSEPEKAVQEMCIASELDCAATGTYAGMLIEARGRNVETGIQEEKTLYLQFNHPSKLTGFCAATTALAVCEGILEPGVYPLYKTEHVDEFITFMRQFSDVFRIFINNGDKSSFMVKDEDEI